MSKSKKEIKNDSLICDILNTIEYNGNVKIKVYNNDTLFKTIENHNTGTIDLCNYIRDVMIGLGMSINQPTVIQPCRKSGGVLVPMSTQGIDFVSRWRGTNSSTEATAVIKFIIPWVQLSNGQVIGGFRLCSKNRDNGYYAEIMLNDDEEITITSHTNIEVEWSLKVTYVI